MQKYLTQLLEYLQKFNIEVVIQFIYYVSLSLFVIATILSIIAAGYFIYKKKYAYVLNCIYCILIAICIEEIGKLFYIVLINHQNIGLLILHVLIIFGIILLYIIIKIIDYFAIKRQKRFKFNKDYKEYEKEVLHECENCHNLYKKNNMSEYNNQYLCKFCIKEIKNDESS